MEDELNRGFFLETSDPDPDLTSSDPSNVYL